MTTGKDQPARFPSPVDLLDAGAALVSAALLVLVGLGFTGGPRVALALCFMTFVPGWAVLDYVRLAESSSRVALAVALSLSLSTLATVAVLWLHLWHPRALLDLGAAACLIAVLWHLAHPEHQAPASASDDRRVQPGPGCLRPRQ